MRCRIPAGAIREEYNTDPKGIMGEQSNIQHIEVTRDAFPKHWTDEKGIRRYTVLIARPDGPYGKVRVKKGQSVFWKEDSGITYYLENVGRKPITFEIIPNKGEPDGTETA